MTHVRNSIFAGRPSISNSSICLNKPSRQNAFGRNIRCPATEGEEASDRLLDASVAQRSLAMASYQDPPAAVTSKPVAPRMIASQPEEWDSWLHYFKQADTAAESKEGLILKLNEAIAGESYNEAAAVKAQINILEGSDAVANIQRQLQTALMEEQYDVAATLRDEGLTGLQGWWTGQSEDDPFGHLLYIKPEYSRWTGRVFRTKDISDMKVRKPVMITSMLPRQKKMVVKPTGTPIIEVFVRPRSNGGEQPVGIQASGEEHRYIHQAVSLRLPTFDEVERRCITLPSSPPPTSPSSPISEELLDPSGPPLSQVVRLNIFIHDDGTTRIRPLPPKLGKQQHLKDMDIAEAEDTMRMLSWSSEPEKGLSSGIEDKTDVGNSQLPQADEMIDRTSQNNMTSMALVPEGECPSQSQQEDGQRFDTNSQSDRSNVQSDGSNFEGLGDLFTELTRDPAYVELVGRDQLIFHIPDSISYTNPGSKSMSADLYKRTSVSSADNYSRLHDKQRIEIMPQEEDSGSSFEFIIPLMSKPSQAPLGTSTQGYPSEELLQRPVDPVSTETLNILADQLAQSMEARIGRAAPREEIADALREVVMRVAAGEPISTVDVTLESCTPEINDKSRGLCEQNPDPDSMTTIKYKRVPSVTYNTDPFVGLYMGSFGPHGPELLHLTRSVVDGDDVVSAMKLTGDANVPAGSLSFQAKVGSKQRLDSRDLYPGELGIVARYKGQGRVAQKGYTQPRWVEGELLVFSGKGSPVTGGAQLGFVWAVPGEKRFLILLNRVDLEDIDN